MVNSGSHAHWTAAVRVSGTRMGYAAGMMFAIVASTTNSSDDVFCFIKIMSSWFCTSSMHSYINVWERFCEVHQKKNQSVQNGSSKIVYFFLWVVLRRAYVLTSVNHLREK